MWLTIQFRSEIKNREVPWMFTFYELANVMDSDRILAT